ncbi:accessory regulator AgrB [Clostridium bovifaecis]|uniref:Accessory regulator AgrB n=1 Tax=Clostridium bovifaecis TaxID=2184719 RepID=A0A6I6F452_9CLOT|nr:accessory regulator AgrB [Clostridium bovifaecis]
MSLTERMSSAIGRKAKLALNIDGDAEKIIVYGAFNLLQTIWSIIWIIIIGLLFNVLYEALLFSIIISVLKKYSGGAHASSPSRCIVIGTAISIGVGMLINRYLCYLNETVLMAIGVFALGFGLLIVINRAPVDSAKKPIVNAKMKKRLKNSSIIVILIYILLASVMLILYSIYPKIIYSRTMLCISLGVLWQSITLTITGISFLNKVDFVLKYII